MHYVYMNMDIGDSYSKVFESFIYNKTSYSYNKKNIHLAYQAASFLLQNLFSLKYKMLWDDNVKY